jgi:hypothetical protein
MLIGNTIKEKARSKIKGIESAPLNRKETSGA